MNDCKSLTRTTSLSSSRNSFFNTPHTHSNTDPPIGDDGCGVAEVEEEEKEGKEEGTEEEEEEEEEEVEEEGGKEEEATTEEATTEEEQREDIV